MSLPNSSMKPPPALLYPQKNLRFTSESSWLLLRPATGLLLSGTSMLLLRPRVAQPVSKLALGRTQDDFLRFGDLGIIVPSRPRTRSLPRPIWSAAAK